MRARAFILFLLLVGFCCLFLLLVGFYCYSYADEHNVSQPNNGDKSIITIGVLVDMGSWKGKVVQSCIKMAISDFYNLNSQYKTRIALHVKDSKGDSLHSIASGEFSLL